MDMLKTGDLPLPVVHCGGFIHRLEKEAVLMGEKLPQIRCRLRNHVEQDQWASMLLAMLEAAPIGAQYKVRYVEEHAHGELVQEEGEVKYRKTDFNKWEIQE